MMRLVLIAAMTLPVYLHAQKTQPVTFGKIEKSELEITNCEFDEDAEAVVLSETGKFYLDLRSENAYSELERHVRIKILKDKGLENANIKIRYYSYKNEETIAGLVANTYNLDNSGSVVTTKLDKNLIYSKRINAKISEQSFTLPNVKVGSVIEYKYVHRGAGMRYWQLQKSIPVKLSKYEIDFPASFELFIKPNCSLPYSSKDNSTGSRTVKTFSMENIPGFRNEKYLTCEADYLQRIESYVVAVNVQGRRYPIQKTWPEVAKILLEDEDFGKQLQKEIPRTVDLDQQLKELKDDYNKMLAVHNYVRKNMKWDGEDNIWALNGVKAAWKEKAGTSGEINLILVNLLKDAGLKAHPILLSTKDHGRLETTFPHFNQFNKVMALVEINGKSFVLDGTDKYHHASLIPGDVMCSEGLVIDAANSNGFRWHELWDETKTNKNVVLLSGSIDEKGMLTGKAVVNSYDYARVSRFPFVKEKQEDFFKRFCSSSYKDIKLDSLAFENAENDTLPLIQKFCFNTPLNTSGEYSFISANIISQLGENPFISDTRYSDVFFGTNQSYTIIANFFIPEGYEFEELPKNIRFSLEDKSLSITRMLAANGNILNARIVLDYKRPFYAPNEYADLKEFYKKMYSLLDEQFVIKKKNG